MFLAALSLTWPAIYNGYPLLYPDSMTYVGDGPPLARALFLHQASDYYGMRSFIYSLGILPFHWNFTPWPVVALQAFLTAFTLWLVVRSVAPRARWSYVTLVGVLSLLTSVSWSASLIMPDILGPSLYLCIYLLIFARETLSRGEHWAAVLIAGWSAASHTTHWVLGVGLCIFVGLLAALWHRFLRGRWKGVAEVAGVFLAVALVQMGLNLYLLGEASLTGEQPPFFMARVIADGPGRWYLERHCGREPKFALCAYAHNLPDDADEFLWGKNSIWATAPAETAKQIRAEERTFVWAVLRAYPRAELACALRAAWRQMFAYGLWDLEGNDWLVSQFDQTLTPGRSRYLSSREARTVLPYEFLETVFSWTLLASLAAIVALTLLLWRKVSPRVAGLGVAIGFAVVANAFVTGAVSTVEDRYEARVIWLVPFLAGVLFLAWLNRRTEIRR